MQMEEREARRWSGFMDLILQIASEEGIKIPDLQGGARLAYASVCASGIFMVEANVGVEKREKGFEYLCSITVRDVHSKIPPNGRAGTFESGEIEIEFVSTNFQKGRVRCFESVTPGTYPSDEFLRLLRQMFYEAKDAFLRRQLRYDNALRFLRLLMIEVKKCAQLN